MAASHVTLPDGWSKTTVDDSASGGYEVRRNSEDGATFVVRVIERDAEDSFKIRLTTISSAEPPVRHDYPVDTYDSVESAFADAESFVHELESRRREGRISGGVPSVGEVQRLIDEFTGSSNGTLLRRLLSRIGR